MNQIETNISKNIKELRVASGMKQSELGEKIAYSDKTISKWEKLFDGTELEKYLSAEGTLRVRYQVADDMDVTNKNCTLPCLQITGKVVNPDA